MLKNFEKCLEFTLAEEGGYSNRKADPGGATMKGVTQRTYDAWRKSRGLHPLPVRNIRDDEVAAIYHGQYWGAVKGDLLPAGVDLATFDYAVNSGPGRAVKDLQRAVGVAADGIVGVQTLAALDRLEPRAVVNAMCDRRLAFVRSLSTWSTFGKGWSARISRIRKAGSLMADGQTASAAPVAYDPPAKANPADAAPSKDPAVQGVGLTGLGGMVEIINQTAYSLFGMAADNKILTALAAALIVGGLAITAYTLVQRGKEA